MVLTLLRRMGYGVLWGVVLVSVASATGHPDVPQNCPESVSGRTIQFGREISVYDLGLLAKEEPLDDSSTKTGAVGPDGPPPKTP